MTTSTDGRVARRQNNSAAVLDAVIELYANGVTDPAVADVSKLSKVSTRSVYRYFNDREGLLREAIRHLRARLDPEVQLADVGEGPLDERIDRFTHARVRVHLEVAPLTRALRRAEKESSTDDDSESDALREEFLAHFAPELASLKGAERSRTIAMADLPFQFEALDYLFMASNQDADELILLLNQLLTMHFAAAVSL